MRFRWLGMCVLAVAAGSAASAQVSAYVDFSASKLTGGEGTNIESNVLYGPSIGLTAQLANKAHLKIYGDVRAAFYGDSIRLDQVALGPKIGLPIHKFEVYGEVLFGFGRYNGPYNASSPGTTSDSTDAQTEVNFGLDRRVSKRLDWRVFEFGYEQYYGLGGEFNPKTFSTGVVMHLGSR